MKHYYHLRSLYLALLLTITTVVVGRAQNSASISANCGAGTLSITGYLASNNRVNIQVFKDDVIIGTINDLVGPSVNQSYGISGAGTYRVRFLEVNNDNNRVESSSISVNCSGGGTNPPTNPPTNPNPNPPSSGQNSATVTPNCGAGSLSITGYLASNNRVNIQVFKDDVIIGTINDLVGPSVNQSYGISGAGTYRVRFLEVNNDNNRIESPSVAVNCSGGGTNPPTNPPTNPNPNPPSGTCSVNSPAGSFDHADCNVVSGWAFDNADLGKTLTIDIYVDGSKVASVSANGDRPDLQSYFGSSAARYHGFTYSFPSNASWKNGQNHTVTVRICGAGNDLGSKGVSGCTGGGNPTSPPPPSSGTIVFNPNNYTYNQVTNRQARMAALAGICYGPSPTPSGCVRIMPYNQNDYNYSLDQFWTRQYDAINMWYCTSENSAVSRPITSPFFSVPTNNQLYDPASPGSQYSADNGWRLAFKDLGVNGNTAPRFPFFALYNIYTGNLRLFVYNPPGRFVQNRISLTLQQWKLDQNANMKVSALFSHATTDPEYSYFNPFDSKYESCNPVTLSAVSVTQTDGWAYADFDLAGYDPQNTQTAVSVYMSDFGQGTFTGIFNGSLSASGTFAGELSGGGSANGNLNNWTSSFKGITSFIKEGKSVLSFDDNESKIKIEDVVSFFTKTSPVGLISAGLDLVSNFIGIYGESQPQKISGTIKLSGSLNGSISGTTRQDGSQQASITLGLTNDLPYNSTPGLYQPVDKGISWGVYTLRKPAFQLTVTEDFTNQGYQEYGPGSGGYVVYSAKGNLFTPIDLLINQNLGMTLVKSEISYLKPDDNNSTLTKASEFMSTNQSFPVVDVATYDQGYDEYGRKTTIINRLFHVPVAYILRLTFTTSTGKTVIINKTYQIPDEVKNKIKSYYDVASQARKGLINDEPTENLVVVRPNPFVESVTVDYTVKSATKVNYQIVDLSGRAIKSEQLNVSEGKHQIIWNGASQSGVSIPKGIYILNLNLSDESGSKRISRKLVKE